MNPGPTMFAQLMAHASRFALYVGEDLGLFLDRTASSVTIPGNSRARSSPC